MKTSKKFKIWLISWLIFMIVRSLRATYRFRYFGVPERQDSEKIHAAQSFCIATWHEYLFAGVLAHKNEPFAPLASLSGDGDILSYVMKRIGYRTVRGSSSRGGKQALAELVDVVNSGWFTALTVDGPRGPRREVKNGIVDISRRTGAPIQPMMAVADREWVLKRSWDQFKLPKPFACIAVRYGPAIVVSPGTEGLAFEQTVQQVKTALNHTETMARQDLLNWGRGVAHGSFKRARPAT